MHKPKPRIQVAKREEAHTKPQFQRLATALAHGEGAPTRHKVKVFRMAQLALPSRSPVVGLPREAVLKLVEEAVGKHGAEAEPTQAKAIVYWLASDVHVRER